MQSLSLPVFWSCRTTCKLLVVMACLLFAITQRTEAGPLYLEGATVAVGEFTPQQLPGQYDRHYTYPSRADYQFLRDQGFNAARIPFLWERLQRQLFAPLDDTEIDRLQASISEARTIGLVVILDVHNYARYHGQTIGSPLLPQSALVDFWVRLSRRFRHDDCILFGLMNEPNGIPIPVWSAAAQAVVHAIREDGASNLILLPGANWSGAHSWFQAADGTSNAAAMAAVVDPLDRLVFEVHQYFDRDFSGTHPECSRAADAVAALAAYTAWLRENGRRAFLGEFGLAASRDCLAALDETLRLLERGQDVWQGWAYFASGPWWGNYWSGIQRDDGPEAPQLVTLRRAVQGNRP